MLWPSSGSYSFLAIHLYHFLSQVLNSQPGWISYFKMSEQMVTSKELSRGGDVDKKLKLELNIIRFLFPKENQTFLIKVHFLCILIPCHLIRKSWFGKKIFLDYIWQEYQNHHKEKENLIKWITSKSKSVTLQKCL